MKENKKVSQEQDYSERPTIVVKVVVAIQAVVVVVAQVKHTTPKVALSLLFFYHCWFISVPAEFYNSKLPQ
jgi:hypothetical protein